MPASQAAAEKPRRESLQTQRLKRAMTRARDVQERQRIARELEASQVRDANRVWHDPDRPARISAAPPEPRRREEKSEPTPPRRSPLGAFMQRRREAAAAAPGAALPGRATRELPTPIEGEPGKPRRAADRRRDRREEQGDKQDAPPARRRTVEPSRTAPGEHRGARRPERDVSGDVTGDASRTPAADKSEAGTAPPADETPDKSEGEPQNE